jgi:hypothetical protein
MECESNPRRNGAIGALAVIVAVVGLLAFSATAGAASWKWSKGYALPGKPAGISSISCPSKKLCVAAGAVGNPNTTGTNDIFWTTNPTGGKSAWHRVALERSVQPQLGGSQEEIITGVSCGKAGPNFHCGATDGFANFWQTGAPISGHWSSQIPDNTGLVALSCWSAWCAMLDANGGAVVQIGATVQSDTSSVFNLPEGTSQESIGCDSSTFCAGVDVSHTLVWSSNVTSQPADWHSARVRGGKDLDTIACPTAGLCVATEGENSFSAWIGLSHHPAGGGGTWQAVHLPKLDAQVYTVTCVSASFCAVGGSKDGAGGPPGTGFVLTSTHPAAKVSAWQRSSLPFADVLALSCPTTSECVAGEGEGDKISVGHK